MGAVIPQVVSATEDRASGAQIIDGSLKIVGDYDIHLTRTLGANGSTAATFSLWVKKGDQGVGNNPAGYESLVDAYVSSATYTRLFFNGYALAMGHRVSNNENYLVTSALFRDTGWYHIVGTSDSNGNPSVYVNGVHYTDYSASSSTFIQTSNAATTSGATVEIATQNGRTDRNFDGLISNFYFIDGQALGPEYFGFTDGLTNTWRPKKYEGTYGTNGFYLPLDGNSPIGQDKSGNGNDWTPVNFGGSVALDNPNVSGARPILNTTQGGTQAGVGVFGSKENKYYTVTTADGSVYQFDITSGDNPSLSFIRGATYKFDYSSFTGHPVLFSSTNPDSSTTAYTDGTSTASNVISFTVPHNAPDTLYYYCQNHPTSMNGSISITTDTKKADPYAWKNVLGLPLVGSKDDVSNQINSGSTTKTITSTNAVANYAFSNFYGGSWYFDGTDDYLSIPSNADFAMGTGDFTVEYWAYYIGGGPTVVVGTTGGLWIGNNNGFNLRAYGVADLVTAPTQPLNKWTHIAVTREGTTARIFFDGVLKASATTSYNFTQSTLYIGGDGTTETNVYIQDLRIYKGVAKYTSDFVVPSIHPDILPDTPSGVSGGSKLAKITDGAVSMDVPGNEYLSIPASEDFNFGTEDFTIEGYFYINSSGGNNCVFDLRDSGSSSQYFMRMTSSTAYDFRYSGSSLGTFTAAEKVWNHIAISRASGTTKIFVNGIQTNSFSDTNDASNTGPLLIGTFNDTTASASSYGFNGAVSNFRVIKGTAIYTSNFTPPTRALTDVTNTKLLCCQSPTSATTAAVSPGSITANGDAAATNFNPFNTVINTVRGQETGYATLNPLFRSGTYSDGNLVQTTTSGNGHYRANIGITTSSGKFYFEYQPTGSNVPGMVGFAEESHSTSSNLNGTTAYSYYGTTGNKQGSPSNVDTSYGATFTFGDVIGVAFDSDNGGSLEFFKNGVSQGVAFSNEFPNFPYYPAFSAGSSSNTTTYNVNFGQKPFKFSPPEGFQPLNAANVRPSTVIARPDQYVGVTTYNGNATTQRIDVGLRPDFVWIKNRDDAGGTAHYLGDTVRGINKNLQSNGTNTEVTNHPFGYVSSVDDMGFTVTQGSNDSFYTNGSPEIYVAWTWKAGGNKNTFNIDDVGYATASAAGLTAGTITPTGASVGTKQGFSIIKFTGNGTQGATISHGLNDVPEFLMIKNLSSAQQWDVYHTSTGYGGVLRLNSNAAFVSAGDVYPSSHTTSTIKLGNSSSQNGNNNNMIAYCWHDVPGLQKFGGFTAGTEPFVELGFRPSLVIIKRTASTDGWVMIDGTRNPYNPSYRRLEADTNGAESSNTSEAIDILSNGFKIKSTWGGLGGSSGSGLMVYAAWAEAPSFNLYGGQSNAR